MKRIIIYLSPIVVLLATLIYSYSVSVKVDKIVVVDVIRVFNEFEMKKELESKVEVELNSYSDHLDSLSALYNLAIENNDNSRANVMKEEIAYAKNEIQRIYDVSNKNINEQVWKRLNILIKEFAKEQHYRIVVGANGMGSVLYNEDATDKTSELISFINTRYETGR